MSSFPARTVLVILLLALCESLLGAPKTDVIRMKNGDRITGEIKSLIRGQLELSTDHMGTILIEWEHIDEVISRTGQAVELANGARFFGRLEKPESADFVRIGTEEGPVGVDSDEIVAMYPVEAGFWDRLDLSAKLGFSWDKSSQVGKYNLGLDGALREVRFVTRGSLSIDLTTQQERDDTSRTYANLHHLRFMKNKRFRAVFGSLENNDELGLDLRTLLGGGYGWTPLRSQRSLLGLLAGVAISNEIPVEGDTETNLEAVGSLQYDFFVYSSPERRIYLDMAVLPSLTEWGRWRAMLNTTVQFEIVDDLFWDLSAYGSYDSDPITAEASTSDYGVSSSIGYNF